MNMTNQTDDDGDAISALRRISTTTEQMFLASTQDTIMEDEITRFSRPLLTFAAIMTIMIMVVGIFGNLLTILALLKCPKVRNVAAAFIISLCLADCLFCAIVLPFSAFRFIQGTWTHGDFLCKLIPFIQYGNIGVSLLCIAMITINRYIMIAHHNAYAKIYKRHWIGCMIAFCWLFSYGMQLPTLFGVWGTFEYDAKLGTCSIMNDEHGNSSKTALFIIAFVIPCIIIIGCYAKIFWVVHRSEVRLRTHANKQNSIPNNLRQMPSGTGPNGVSDRASSSSFSTTSGAEASKYGTSQKTIRVKDQRDIKAKRNEWRITKMVLAIFLSFVVCYLPITVVKVADKDVYSPSWHIIAYIMLYLSACINPIIYVIMNKQYRKAYKTVLMCQPSRLLPFTNAGSSAGEKWKDIGSNYNHSRTMVSQVSVVDQQTSSNSCSSNQSPVVLELSPQSMRPPQTQSLPNGQPAIGIPTLNTNKNSDHISPSIKTSTQANSQSPSMTDIFMALNNNNNSKPQLDNQNQNSVDLNPQPQAMQQPPVLQLQSQQPFTKPQDGSPHQGTRIALAEGDIIVEEEEEELEEELERQTSSTISPNNPFKLSESQEINSQILANLSIAKKDAQYEHAYKLNINAIPDSNAKVKSKSNILDGY